MVTLFACCILVFLRFHFFHIVSKVRFALAVFPILLVLVAVIVNLFVPFLFQIDENNVYQRLNGYYFLLALDVLCLICSFLMYVHALSKGKATRFFPYYLFMVPIIFGTLFQTFVANVCVIWPSFIIALAGVIASIKSEHIFRDELTGLYNRAYFNYAIHSALRKKQPVLTGIMLDINDFKNINDHFGHDFGDKALTDFADLLVKSVGHIAPIIRLSGDEFVILVKTADKKEISRYIDHINLGFEEFNNSKKRPYELFASLGYATYTKVKLQKNSCEILTKTCIGKRNVITRIKNKNGRSRFLFSSYIAMEVDGDCSWTCMGSNDSTNIEDSHFAFEIWETFFDLRFDSFRVL